MCHLYPRLTPLRLLQCAGVIPPGLSPNAIWQMDVIHYGPFDNVKDVHVIIDTWSSFVYVLAYR